MPTELPTAPLDQTSTPVPEPVVPAGSLHVVVDLNRCQGYAQCCFLAHGVFWLHGEEALWYEPAPEETLREQVRRAAAACPVQAILLEWPEGPNNKETEEPHA